jgi:hypothetical protein
MKCRNQAFPVIHLLFGMLLSLNTGTLDARDADLASRTSWPLRRLNSDV